MLTKLNSLLKHLDKRILFYLSIFLLAFIPLYPKLPLAEIIPGYIVRVRLEDLFVFLAGGIWLLQAIRGKISWPKSFLALVFTYAGLGAISILFGVFILQSIPFQPLHVGKSFLHWVRYLEYFSLLFISFAGIRSKKDLKWVIGVLAATVLIVTLYGFGQKYLRFPLYSTMNREFSKGETLYLTEFARVQSTFGGHYDMAAFLVISLPILFALALTVKPWPLKGSLILIHFAGLSMIILAAAKTSLIAYAISMSILVCVWLWQTYRHSLKTMLMIGSLFVVGGVLALGAFGYLYRAKLTNLVQKIYQPTASKPTDVYIDVPDLKKVEIVGDDGEITYELIEKERVWSDNALKYGLSMGIRLDTLWPQALRGFESNMFFGKGFATLSKEDNQQFTEAESTDNNYLRTLGETGLLGFLSYYGILWLIWKGVKRSLKSSDDWYRGLNLGFMASMIGISINALYIDVFAASKVAFTLWALSGVVIGSWFLDQPLENSKRDRQLLSKAWVFISKNWWLMLVLFTFGLLLHHNPWSQFSLLRDLSPLIFDENLIPQVAAPWCWLQGSGWNLCLQNEVIQAGPISLYSLLLIPLYKFHPNPALFYYLNLILSLTSLGFFISILKKKASSTLVRTASSLLYVLTPMVYLIPATPSPRNLQLTIALFWSYLASKFSGNSVIQKGLLAVGGLYILIQTFMPPTPSSFYIWFPVLILLAAPGIEKAIVQLWDQDRFNWKSINKKALIIAGVSLVAVLSLLPTTFSSTISNFRESNIPWNYQVIEVAERHFAQPAGVDGTSDSYLISALKPELFEFYSPQHPKPVPLLDELTLLPSISQTMQEENLSNLDQYYSYLLNQESKLEFNDVFVNTSQNVAEAFEKLKSNFDLEINSLDCQENCNFYNLYPNGSLSLGNPKTANQIDPKSISNQQKLRVTITRDIFGSIIPLTAKSRLAARNSYSQQLQKLDTDLLLNMGGDLSNPKSRHPHFMLQFGSQVGYPVVTIPAKHNNRDDNLYGPASQAFKMGNTAFLILNTTQPEISKTQIILAYNTLLRIEKDKDIKNLVILSHQLPWQEGRDDYQDLDQLFSFEPEITNPEWFSERFLPRLKQLKDLKTLVITSNTQPLVSPSVIYDHDQLSNITYLSWSANHSLQNLFLNLEIDPAEEDIKIELDSLSGLEVESIENYTTEYWEKQLPIDLKVVEEAKLKN